MTKPVLITGASRGLGAALAEALAPTYHVIAVARTVGALEELDDRIKAAGGDATLAPMDVTNDAAMQHLCLSIHERWGGLSFWGHTAIHAAPLAPAPDINAKDWSKSVEVNLTATQRLIGYVAPLLGSGGTAAFFGDIGLDAANYGSYGATKAAQLSLIRSWQAETLRTGPKVKLLDTAPMPTALRARFHPGEDRSGLATPAEEAARLIPKLELS